MKRDDFLLACNFKAGVVDEHYFEKISHISGKNVIIFPNFCEISHFLELKQMCKIKIGAQNVSGFLDASHTGEITVNHLKSLGVDFCIVGHSECRKNFFETHESINKKLELLLEKDITPVLCVGENISKNISQTDFAVHVVFEQLEAELANIDATKVIIAYEPVWAIGTGQVATAEHIQTICSTIKNKTHCQKCLYGGSVNAKNFINIAKISAIDGVLIGSASLKADNIIQMQNMLKALDC